MKILIFEMDSLFPTKHGGAWVLRNIAKGLASIGHQVTVMLLAHEGKSQSGVLSQNLTKLQTYGHLRSSQVSQTTEFEFQNVKFICVNRDRPQFHCTVISTLRLETPDTVLVTDNAQIAALELLVTIRRNSDCNVVFLPMTIHHLPFGPDSLRPNLKYAEEIRKSHVVAISRHLRNYFLSNLNKTVAYCMPPVFQHAKKRDNFMKNIAMFNPTDIKGFTIFLNIAKRRPDYNFIIQPGWGSNESTVREIEEYSNISIIEKDESDPDNYYREASVVLVPSLCNESFGIVSLEAMLQGIPVVASKYGGLIEAKLDVPFLVPVRPIVFGEKSAGNRAEQLKRIPEQYLEQWLDALDRLVSDQDFYSEVSELSYKRSVEYIDSLSWASFCDALIPNRRTAD